MTVYPGLRHAWARLPTPVILHPWAARAPCPLVAALVPARPGAQVFQEAGNRSAEQSAS